MRSRSSSGVIGDTARPSEAGRWRELGVRVAAAGVLVPPVLAAFYFGPPYSSLVVLLATGIAAWEWARLAGGGSVGLAGASLIAGVVLGGVAAALNLYSVAGWVIALGTMGAALGATRERSDAPWSALGALYLGCAALAFIWLRQGAGEGRALIFWLLAVVWITDTAAYFVGRALGGRKLAPAISPGKTWAGLWGGLAAAALVGVATALWLGETVATAVLASIGLAVASQLGDLFESRLKRRFGVKDSSDLIPGHGGMLDRIDSLLAGALAVAGLAWLLERSP